MAVLQPCRRRRILRSRILIYETGNDAAKKNTAKNAFDGSVSFDFDLASLCGDRIDPWGGQTKSD